VFVGVAVGTIGVLVGVFVGVAVGAIGVLVGVFVGVGVSATGVLVGVSVGVGVSATGVLVGVSVAVGVSTWARCPAPPALEALACAACHTTARLTSVYTANTDSAHRNVLLMSFSLSVNANDCRQRLA